MSIFAKPVSAIGISDLQELLDEKAVENIRLEFKSEVPDKDETLKKISSFANSYGGFMVIGAKASGKDGRIVELPGVEEQSGYKQKVVQWCFDAVSPPLVVEVSDAIPTSGNAAKFCYVIYTPESEIAPHFLNDRKGIWVRTDEFSQRYEPQLAVENEIRHLLDRRRLVEERRTEIIQRSRRRYEQFLLGLKTARLEVSIGPRFPARPICSHADLLGRFKSCAISWRGVNFPQSSANLISQHESIINLTESETKTMVEATTWGTLFYATNLVVDLNDYQIPLSGIHLYNLVGHLLAFIRHAEKMLSGWLYNGPMSIDVLLGGILGISWLYRSQYGITEKGPSSVLDDSFTISLQTTTEELFQRPDTPALNILQYILFGTNWADVANSSQGLEKLLHDGYKFNSWGQNTPLRL